MRQQVISLHEHGIQMLVTASTRLPALAPGRRHRLFKLQAYIIQTTILLTRARYCDAGSKQVSRSRTVPSLLLDYERRRGRSRRYLAKCGRAYAGCWECGAYAGVVSALIMFTDCTLVGPGVDSECSEGQRLVCPALGMTTDMQTSPACCRLVTSCGCA